MQVLVIGRSPFPAGALAYGSLADDTDQAVVERSHRLGDLFHGMVEMRVHDSNRRRLLKVLEGFGWKEYVERPKCYHPLGSERRAAPRFRPTAAPDLDDLPPSQRTPEGT